MRAPSGDSKTTEQKSPVARDICSATIASKASMSGTASLNASAAAAIAAMRCESSTWSEAGGSDPAFDTMQLYSAASAIALSVAQIAVRWAEMCVAYRLTCRTYHDSGGGHGHICESRLHAQPAQLIETV